MNNLPYIEVEVCCVQPPEVLSDFEYTVLISQRVQDLMNGDDPLVEVPKGGKYDYFEIATREIREGKFTSRVIRGNKIIDPKDTIVQYVRSSSSGL